MLNVEGHYTHYGQASQDATDIKKHIKELEGSNYMIDRRVQEEVIPRYTRKQMAGIWSEENRYQKWLDVELAACEAWAKLGKIPKKSLATIKKKACFTVERIEEIEAVTRHDVIAFVSCVAEYVGEDARFIHMGLTSSDVLDTAYSLLLKESSTVIIEDIKALMASLKKRAYEFKDTPAMGRSHGIHAEPITFGLKFALWYSEMERNLTRMLAALDGDLLWEDLRGSRHLCQRAA